MSARASTCFAGEQLFAEHGRLNLELLLVLEECLQTFATPVEFLPPTITAVGPVREASNSGRPSDFAATRSELFLTT
jgi:hypothetical protein